MKQSLIIFYIILIIVFFSCQKVEIQTIDAINANIDLGDNARDYSSYKLPSDGDLAAIPQDPNNPLTTDKVALGKLLFHETRLSINPQSLIGLRSYSCASCHHAEAGFQSSLSQAIGEGGIGFGIAGEARIPSPRYNINDIDVQPVRSPSVMNTAYQQVMLWSGGFGSKGVNAGTEYAWIPGTVLEKNYLGYEGLESLSIGGLIRHRLIPDTVFLAKNATYKNLYNLAFPELSEERRVSSITTGLAIAAYQRTILANNSPFQRWIRGEKKAMTGEERTGKNIFFGKGKCSSCHTGPALNSTTFFALGMADMTEGVNGAINISSDPLEDKGRGGFTQRDSDMYKFKTPQLYNLKDVNFLGHGGTFKSVEEVVRYKNAGIPQNQRVPASQITAQFIPLGLTETEIGQLVKFIENALYDPTLTRYSPVSVPSGNCIPNNDPQSKLDRGCN